MTIKILYEVVGDDYESLSRWLVFAWYFGLIGTRLKGRRP